MLLKLYHLLTVFLLITILPLPLPAQDTTITEVAPGFIHYVINDPQGPYHINILEIDVTDTTVILETALARDRLGGGLERTSALSGRISRSGYVVVGAINGDFYGISQPLNPYGFLANSQILNSEYVFGRTFHRSSFGVRDGRTPLVDIINFNGSLIIDDNLTYSISRVNAQRLENNLIVYNAFFGPSTDTNKYGTEVRLQPVSEISTASPVSMVVREIETGVGNMNIGAGDYILSGHGTASSFLTNYVTIGDTVSLTLGTYPDLDQVTALIGGGPRIIDQGTRPESFVGHEGMGDAFVNTAHPRTAVGMNKDSTKVYFITVDGRQDGFSLGMSLSRMADYLIDFGVYNAVNLDGGGSTTMVVHDVVVNSPSDPGGERSVANALLAVRKVTVNFPGEPESLYPADGAENQPDTVHFSWHHIEDVESYRIQIATSEEFHNIIVDRWLLQDTTFVLTGHEGQTTYYWRVKSRNAAGISDYTPVHSFTTGFPVTPVLVSPERADSQVPRDTPFHWSSTPTTENYTLQIATNNVFTREGIIVDTTALADTTLTGLLLDPNRLFFWRVRAHNQYGASLWSAPWGFRTTDVTDVMRYDGQPEAYALHQNYPNPFNPVTTIRYDIPETAHVRLNVYNAVGQHIDTLVNVHQDAGFYTITWNAAAYASGFYYCTLVTKAGFSKSIPMVLLR
jgi:hypothetical protein